MKQRIISALIAIPLFLAIILFAPQVIYLAFWHLCIIVCSYEFFKIRGLCKVKSLISAILVGSVAPLLFYINIFNNYSIDNLWKIIIIILSSIVILSWCIFIPIFFSKYNKNQLLVINNILLFFMWFCIITCFFMFVAVWNNADEKFGNTRYILLLILVTIWANDAGAYFVGKAIGKRKFSPIISPNKTWEGFWGGVVVATLTMTIICFAFPILDGYEAVYVLIVAPIIAIFATVGDLFQSMLKRMAGVKDSGNIMPGHGGVFDRIDSWLSVGSMFIALISIYSVF